MKIAAGYFTKAITNHQIGVSWPRYSVAAIPFKKTDEQLMELCKKGFIKVAGMDDLFKTFHCNKGGRELFTHIGGGIGDVIAFSSVAEYLKDYPLQVHTTEKYKPIFDWFKHDDIVLKSWFDPIANYYNPKKFQHLHRLSMEFAAIEAREKNWYQAFFERIGLDAIPEGFGRPHLRTDRISDSEPFLTKDSVLICHRSSCQMRSSKFEDFYYPVKNAYPKLKIYVHETDLTDEDKEFVKKRRNITVLPKCSISDYLLNLYDAGFVLTTDSAAIHFREGIEKPALGIFSAMTTESRTSEYIYTKSFNVQSDCEHQPCFIHELIKGQVCANAEEGDRVAKCQTGQSFQEQLLKALNEY